MSARKNLTLEEANTPRLLKRFCKERSSKGDRGRFFRLLNAMAKAPETSAPPKPIDTPSGK